MNQLLIATNNNGKIKELHELLDDMGIDLVTPSQVGLTLDVIEDGDTYTENATKKPLAFAQASGLISLADDSGLEVDALNGAPGAEGYRVLTAADGETGLDRALEEKPDLILLHIMMPEMSGYDFIKAYRKESETPIILLTAKLDETDKVLGLELGADDYVTKPFGMKELTARIHAVLRRALRTPLEPDTLKIGSIHLDKDSRTVTVDNEPSSLTPSEFDLLYVFMSAPGKVFSRSDLLLKLQGTTFEGVERTIDVHIRNLRTKIEQDPSNPQYIQTVFGVGYKFAVS